MNDSELESQYAGYSDQQLAEFIASKIPEWQADQFRRLLVLRRRKHYLCQIDSSHEPSVVFEHHQLTKHPKLPSQKQPIAPPDSEPKKKSSGCGSMILYIIGIILYLILASFVHNLMK